MNKSDNFDVFISYRRYDPVRGHEGGGMMAKYLYDYLLRFGYRVSYDIDTLRAGPFDEALFSRIDKCTDFIVVLSKGCFDRTIDPEFPSEKDWLRQELSRALKGKKNIVTVRLPGFAFPDGLPDDVRHVSAMHGPEFSMGYVDEFCDRLMNDFLHSHPSRSDVRDDAVLISELGKKRIDDLSLSTLQGDSLAHLRNAVNLYRALRLRPAVEEIMQIHERDDVIASYYRLKMIREIDGSVDETIVRKACEMARDAGCTDAMVTYADYTLEENQYNCFAYQESARRCIQVLSEAISRGNAEALSSLADAFSNGNGVTKNEVKAKSLYKKAEEQGGLIEKVIFAIVNLYSEDADDKAQAIEILKHIVGHVQRYESDVGIEGLFILALAYSSGIGVVENVKMSQDYWERIISFPGKLLSGDCAIRAMANLSVASSIIGGDRNPSGWQRALDCAIKALPYSTYFADGNIELVLSRIYSEKECCSVADVDVARNYLEIAAVRGNVSAKAQLAIQIFTSKEGDKKRARELLSESVNAQDCTGLNIYGKCLVYGLCDYERDVKRGVELLRMTAENGDGDAMATLGQIYEKGAQGIRRDFDVAVQWYKKGVDVGDSDAIRYLSDCYFNGNGVEQNLTESENLLRKSVARGNVENTRYLAAKLMRDDYGPEREKESIELTRRIADCGDARSMMNMGIAYSCDNMGVSADYATAKNWFERSFESGECNAGFRIAELYENGCLGTERRSAAIEWYVKAANAGDCSSMMRLSDIYMGGLLQVESDTRKAIYWLRKGVDAGDVACMWKLGACYHTGIGVPKSVETAERLFIRAADTGDLESQTLLGICYFAGFGFRGKGNWRKGLDWLTKAAMLKWQDAIDKMQKLVGVSCNATLSAEEWVSSFEWIGKNFGRPFWRLKKLLRRICGFHRVPLLCESDVALCLRCAARMMVAQGDDVKAAHLFEEAISLGDKESERQLGDLGFIEEKENQ